VKRPRGEEGRGKETEALKSTSESDLQCVCHAGQDSKKTEKLSGLVE